VTGFKLSFPVRIYYEDTDHGGVVYHANYLKYMERARTEFLRTLGIELDELQRDHGVLFAVTEAHVRFRAPARYNDLLRVESALVQLGGASIAFRQQIIREKDERLLIDADIALACIGGHGRVRRIPKAVVALLRTHLLSKEAP